MSPGGITKYMFLIKYKCCNLYICLMFADFALCTFCNTYLQPMLKPKTIFHIVGNKVSNLT